MSDNATYFDVTIPWDSVNKADEVLWVQKILRCFGSEDHDVRLEADDYSRKLKELRKDSDFEFLRFKVEATEDGLRVHDEGELDGGDPDQAALFISAFLERWRPGRAVKLPWKSVSSKGRGSSGTTLIGPEGITAMKAVSRKHQVRR